MLEFKHEQDVFVKAEQVKGLIRSAFGDHLTHNQIQRHLALIVHNKYFNAKITGFQEQIRELLDQYKIGYRSAYRWLRATKLPEDIKEEVQKGKVSLTKAFEVNANLSKRRKASLGLQILEQGRALINHLEE